MTVQRNVNSSLKEFYTDIDAIVYSQMKEWQINEFRRHVLDFLNCETYPDAEVAADSLNKYIMSLHGKVEAFRKAFDDLDRVEKELYKDYQRLHLVHQAHVFLIGMYLYGTFPKIREAVDQEMIDTCGGFLSAGSAVGEFLFRWRMASLVHDLGYSLSLLADNGHLDVHLQGYQHIIERPICRPEELYRYQGKELFHQVSDLVMKRYGFSLRPIIDALKKKHPFPNDENQPPFYDHAILSAVVFLYLINFEYSKQHEDSLDILGYELSWDEKYLDACFPEIAMAVALHNLDAKNYDTLFTLNEQRYYKAKPSPFAWLLKVSDLLQEWDKPETNNMTKRTGRLESLVTDFKAEDGRLIVNDFTGGADVKKKIERYDDAPISITVNLSE